MDMILFKRKIKIRRSWGALNPVTRIVPNKKKESNKDFYRRRFKEELREIHG